MQAPPSLCHTFAACMLHGGCFASLLSAVQEELTASLYKQQALQKLHDDGHAAVEGGGAPSVGEQREHATAATTVREDVDHPNASAGKDTQAIGGDGSGPQGSAAAF